MSELSDLTGAGDSVSIPGHIISPPGLVELADAETAAANQYMNMVEFSTKSMPPDARQAAIQKATEQLSLSPFKASSFTFHSFEFQQWAATSTGTQYLGWLSLRIRKPEITLATAGELFGKYPKAILSVWKVWGLEKKAQGVEAVLAARAKLQTGQQSSESSPPQPPQA